MAPGNRLHPTGCLMRNIQSSLLCLLLAMLLWAALSTAAQAQRNTLEPRLQFGIRYDTNLRFAVDGSETDGAQGLLVVFNALW